MSSRDRIIKAAKTMDWGQVVANGGPPCFHLEEEGFFCGRTDRWEGHVEQPKYEYEHRFIPLHELLYP